MLSEPAGSHNGGEVIIREFREIEDFALVKATWIRSYMEGRTQSFWHVRGRRAWRGHRGIVDQLIRTHEVRVACLKDVPDAVVGWVCFEGECLHYIFTKFRSRGSGIARALLRDVGPRKFYSHNTKDWKEAGLGREMWFSPGHAFWPPLQEEEQHED